MAGIAYVRKRVYNPELIVDPDGVLPMKLRQSNIKGYNPIYYIKWVGGTQVAAEELGTAKTATKDGTTTPYLVNLVSSSVLDDYDDTATGAVRACAVVGLSVSSVAAYTAGEVPLVTVEVIRTNGTADVNSTRYFLWTDAFYAVLWGVEPDAKGNIDLEAPSGTPQIRILATQNEGEGGQWHFPPNRRLFIHSVDINTTAALAAGDGVVLTNTCTNFDDVLNTDPDLEVDYYTYVHNNQGHKVFKPASPIGRYTTVSSSCVWSEALVANTQTISLEIAQYLDRGEG